jgi:hypothetical protein
MNLSKHQSTIVRLTVDAREQLIGCQVRLNTKRAKRYNGRLGSIQGVIPDADHGLLVLVMIFYDGQTVGWPGSVAYLNGHRLTRSYWPLNELLFTGQMAFKI